MEVIVELVSKFQMPESRVCEALQLVLNKLCGQELILPSVDVEKMEEAEVEIEGEVNDNDKKGNKRSKYFHIEAHFEDSTTTMGVDDTRKGHGHRVHDVKATHVTIINQEKQRSTFTTGYMPNISHSGQDAAESLTATMDILACLGGCTTGEVKTYLHLFHSDSAGDADVMLDCLDVDETRRIQCNAHPVLCIENALDNIFSSHERSVGKEKLISS